ncbi:MAG TPA: MarR family winged helix-turn-helix transcriptional regulator [Candidatus Elarobacter sp.]|nr:MarR family winged helix-turn-helix transcriptional regulator [Candidatus Elarobacter sp.]HEV2737017.1 MarR family winged helix-turn-helix transcriptional regulator [Candidatus Elarobacter sp.]
MARTKAIVESAFDADPQRSVGYLIRDSARLILAKLQLQLEPHDVTLGQYFVLRELWEREGATQRQLSARIGIGEQSAVATIDAMEQRDLVVRVRSKQDRRKTHIYLTARGRGLREQLLSYAAHVINTATDGFEPGEVDTLRALLAKLKQRLEQPG